MKAIKAVFLGCLAVLALSAHSSSLTFGVVPQQNAIRTAQIWGPLLTELERLTGVDLALKTAPNIPEFEAALARQEYDIAYMNPYHFTVFHERSGYQAMVHRGGKGIRGVIVTAKGSQITQLKQLDGQLMAFPAPAAFAATLLTQAEMAEAGAVATPKYTSSHDSVYRAVAAGLIQAGGGIGRTLAATDPEVREKLQVLHTTREYTPHAIASLASLPDSLVETLTQALLQIDSEAILGPIKIPGFVRASNDSWNDVRALELKVIQ